MGTTFVIVGAGQAGAWIAKTLRRSGCDARIVMIGDEDTAPYERPPLSKEVLRGEALPASTTLLSHEAAEHLGVELWLGETVTRIDRAARRAHCRSGHEIEYTKLFLAMGSRVRKLPLPGIPAERICYLRTLRDGERLREALARSERVLVIGGGWIGLEVASAIRGMEKQVSVIEMAPRLCARAVPPVVSEFLRALHQRHGVDVRIGTLAKLVWNGEAVQATPEDGSRPITADVVVVAAGIVPNVELAVDSGLVVDNGVMVDEYGRTSDPDILAAGDVTNHPSAWSGTRERLESWDNAQNQALAVARAALDPVAAYGDIPWFWSDQYDVNLQILGLPPASIEPQRRGDPASGQCLWFFWQSGRLASVIGVNSPRDIRIAKKWMREGRFPKPEAVLDESVKLQKLPLE